mmetsp:Transcript_35933/g.112833  ORF Transcript_35933/g.112833 Transcript_35933/m.112833 type:complete len:201 (-) Transcript_35933:291-893(-)
MAAIRGKGDRRRRAPAPKLRTCSAARWSSMRPHRSCQGCRPGTSSPRGRWRAAPPAAENGEATRIRSPPRRRTGASAPGTARSCRRRSSLRRRCSFRTSHSSATGCMGPSPPPRARALRPRPLQRRSGTGSRRWRPRRQADLLAAAPRLRRGTPRASLRRRGAGGTATPSAAATPPRPPERGSALRADTAAARRSRAGRS